MSMPMTTIFDEQIHDDFGMVPEHGMPTSEYLTSPSPSNPETRRDSIVSSQSSMSLSSCFSDYTGPMTSPSVQNSMLDDPFVDAMPGDAGQDMSCHPPPNIVLNQQPKSIGPEENHHGPWPMMPHETIDNGAIPISTSHLFRYGASNYNLYVLDHMDADMSMVCPVEGPWTNTIPVTGPEARRQWDSGFAQPKPMDGGNTFWTDQDQLQQSQDLQMILVSSGTIPELEYELAHHVPPTLSDAESSDHLNPSLPQSPQLSDAGSCGYLTHPWPALPQEVYCKQEGSPSSKPEIKTERNSMPPPLPPPPPPRSRRSNPRKSRSTRLSRAKRALVKTEENGDGDFEEYSTVKAKLENCRRQYDEKSGKWKVVPLDKEREERHFCGICAKAFKRQEHLKRHKDTSHAGPNQKLFRCRLEKCSKIFNRHDNLIQHYTTHCAKPWKKVQRNSKLPLDVLIQLFPDLKIKEKIIGHYNKEWEEEVRRQGGRC